jgi:hypothetical protein
VPVRLNYYDLGDGVSRPYLVIWRDQNVPFLALIDSGADGSSLPLNVARVLGVPYNPADIRTARGAGGPYNEWQATADVTLQMGFGQVTLARPALNPTLPYILLGRRDFFAQYRVSFDQQALAFELDVYPPPAGP